MKNLLKETLQILKNIGKSIDDIDFINHKTLVYNEDNDIDVWETNKDDNTFTITDWNGFLKFAKHFENYDNGYGGAEVPECYIVFKDCSWLERGEYDGAEWWEYKKCPTKNTKRY